MKRNVKFSSRDKNVSLRGWATRTNGEKIMKKSCRRHTRHLPVLQETVTIISDEQRYLEMRLECLEKAQELIKQAKQYAKMAEKARKNATVIVDLEGVLPSRRHDKGWGLWCD